MSVLQKKKQVSAFLFCNTDH